MGPGAAPGRPGIARAVRWAVTVMVHDSSLSNPTSVPVIVSSAALAMNRIVTGLP